MRFRFFFITPADYFKLNQESIHSNRGKCKFCQSLSISFCLMHLHVELKNGKIVLLKKCVFLNESKFKKEIVSQDAKKFQNCNFFPFQFQSIINSALCIWQFSRSVVGFVIQNNNIISSSPHTLEFQMNFSKLWSNVCRFLIHWDPIPNEE